MAEYDLPEEWRVIQDFPDYAVSNLGRVRRETDSHIPQGSAKAGTILRLVTTGRYHGVHLYRAGRTLTRSIHSLVCEAFHGPKPTKKHEVAHWDGDNFNCKATNLRWATRAENMDDMIRHGRTGRFSGKLTESDVIEIRRRLASGESHEKIAADYPVTRSMISMINAGRLHNWLFNGEVAFVAYNSRKLSENDVKEIRRLIGTGATNKALASQFGVNPATISQIRHGHLWKHQP